MFRLQGITIFAAALIFLSGCAQTGSTGDGESAQVEGSVARAVYDKVMLSRSAYKNLPAKKKTLSACINWAGTSETSVDLRYSMAYYEGEFSERTVPTGELMNSAMLECEREQKNQNLDCECVEVDRNGSPVLIVPKSVISEYLLPDRPAELPDKAAEAFLDYKTKFHYRAFAITPSKGRGKWAYGRSRGQLEVNRAVDLAMKNCQVAREQYGVENECQIYAVGDFIVDRMNPQEREAATAFYKNDPFAGVEEMQSKTRAPLTPAKSGKFDGDWQGRMSCAPCSADAITRTGISKCIGGLLEKPVKITIENGEFVFALDWAYVGVGRADNQGNVQIRWVQSETYAEMTKPKNIRFAGQIIGRQLQLDGERGPRKCTVTLERETASES